MQDQELDKAKAMKQLSIKDSAIEEKYPALALIHDYLRDRDNQIQPCSMKTWHCMHKEMCIRPSYKDVKIPSPIIEYIM